MILRCLSLALAAAVLAGCGADFTPPLQPQPAAQSFRLVAINGTVLSMWADPGGEVFAICDNDLLRYDGQTWRFEIPFRSALSRPSDIWGASPDEVFAVGRNGNIFHYDGLAWTKMQSGTSADLSSVWGSSGSDVFAVGPLSTILHYDGSGWSRMEAPAYRFPQDLRDVWGSSGSDVFAAGNSAILHYDGNAWSVFHEAGGGALWGSGNQVFVGSLWDGVVHHYDGNTWSVLQTGTTQGFTAAWGTSASDVFFVGSEALVHWNGSAWSEELRIDPEKRILCIGGRGPGDVFLGGGRLLHHDGSSWSDVLSFIGPVQQACEVSDTEFFTFGGRQDEAYYFDGGAWISLGEPYENVHAVAASSAGDIFVVGTHDNDLDSNEDGYVDGHILHYTRAGRDKTWWAPRGLRGVWVESTSSVYAVGEAGLVFHYDGFAWEEMESGTGISLSAVWGSDGSDIFAAGSDATAVEIYHYDGASWSFMTRYERFPGYGRMQMWGSSSRDVYLGLGDVFLHYDGTTWAPVDAGTPIRVTDIWGRSSTDVYVTGDVGILRWDGRTWEQVDQPGNRLLVWGTKDALYTTGYRSVRRLDQD